MLNFFKKREKPNIQKKVIFVGNLKITFKNKTTLSWTVESEKPFSKVAAWKSFYKWYFGRTAKCFLVKYKDGETMIQREEILIFENNLSRKIVDA